MFQMLVAESSIPLLRHHAMVGNDFRALGNGQPQVRTGAGGQVATKVNRSRCSSLAALRPMELESRALDQHAQLTLGIDADERRLGRGSSQAADSNARLQGAKLSRAGLSSRGVNSSRAEPTSTSSPFSSAV